MKNFIIVMILILTGFSAAQKGIIERLDDLYSPQFYLMAKETNPFGTVFIELNRSPANVEAILREGIMAEDAWRYVIATPAGVYTVERTGEDMVYKATKWGADMFTDPDSSFTMVGANGSIAERHPNGMAPDVYKASFGNDGRPRATPRPQRPRYAYPAPTTSRTSTTSSRTSTTSCTSSSTHNSSSVTCFHNGRIVSKTTCTSTTSGNTSSVTCRSYDY